MRPSMSVLKATAAASLFAAPAFAQSQSYDLTGFDKITLSTGLQVEIVVGPEFTILAQARNARVLRKLEIETRGRTLYASRDSNLRDFLFGGDTTISLTITLPNLREISISSGVDANVSGNFSEEFSGSASSGAALTVEGMTANIVEISAASGAIIDIDGTCGFLEAKASSGAELGAEGLRCNAVEITSSSGANAFVFAIEALDSRASSGGSINVFGAPGQTDISNSSGGKTRLRD